jgi:hypothetical protein
MYKHIRNFFALSFLCTAGSAVALSACDAPSDGPGPESQALRTPAELGLGDGWVEQEEGLWSRIGADGQEEFVGVGEPGKLHGLASLHAAEEQLALAAEAEGTEEAKARLAELRALIVDIESAELVAPSADDPSFRCDAQLTHFTLAGGAACNSVKADASVTFNNYCNSATETIYTYTYATCGVVTTTHSCGPKTGTSIGCGSHSYLTSATSACESYAYAASNYYSTWQLNHVKGYCEPPPVCNCQAGFDCHCGDFEGCVPKNQLCN